MLSQKITQYIKILISKFWKINTEFLYSNIQFFSFPVLSVVKHNGKEDQKTGYPTEKVRAL